MASDPPQPAAPAADQPPAQPTEQQAAAASAAEIAQAVVAAMQNADSPADAQRQVADVIEEELHVSEADAKRIAQTTIAELEARGAFEPPAQPSPEPAGPTAEQVAEPGEGGEGEPASGGEADQPPVRKTLAERFLRG